MILRFDEDDKREIAELLAAILADDKGLADSQKAAYAPSASVYSMQQLAVATTQLIDAGKRGDVLNLLQSFGIQTLTQLPPERYSDYAARLREQGVRI